MNTSKLSNGNAQLQALIRKKQESIYKRRSDGFQNTECFKRFHSSLVSYINSRTILEHKVLLITKTDLESLPENFYDRLCLSLSSDEFVFHPMVVIDCNLNITSYSKAQVANSSVEVRNVYREISTDFVLFVIHPNSDLNYFIDGDEVGESVFYTSDDVSSYNKKFDVSQIKDVFAGYRNHLTIRSNYNKFFVPKSHLESLRVDLSSSLEKEQFFESNRHLLINRPEDSFRDDLRQYLELNLRATLLTKEYILENFKRLDIFLLDETGSGLFLIEVKWIGVSVRSCGKKIGTMYGEADIHPGAIIQTIGYIEQLHKEGKNIKLGYLAVFDARAQEVSDTSFDYSALNLDERVLSKFRRLENFRVVNVHPR